MKHLKLLLAAPVAALVVLAFGGGGSASADELCTEAFTNPCPGSKLITTVEMSQFGSGAWETTGGSTLASCNGGHLAAAVESQGTGVARPGGKITKLTWTECSVTVQTTTNGSLSFESRESLNGTVFLTGTAVTMVVFGTSCTYGAGTGLDIGTLNSVSGDFLVSTLMKKTAGGALCPSEVRWTTKLEVTNHSTVNVLNN